jgi:hypothetical protein
MSKADQKAKVKNVHGRLRELSTKPPQFDQVRMAERAESARLLLHDAARLPERRKEKSDDHETWRKCIDLFNRCLSEAFPAGFWNDFERLKKGDTSGLETAIRFLEADPWFFRSGYLKADLIRFICRCPLTAEQADRLRDVVLNAIELRDRREFRQFANLGRVVQSEEFREEVSKRLLHEDEAVRRRARWVLDSL